MKKMRFILMAGLLLGAYITQAQIETMYSMYRLNPVISSPAFAGEVAQQGEVTAMNRQQWIGIQGAPRTMAFTGNFKWKAKTGLSFLAMSDIAGPMKISTVAGDFAYQVKLNDAWKISGGVRLGASTLSLDYDGIQVVDPSDPVFAGDRSTGIKFNTGWGVRLGNAKGFFVSISQPRVIGYDFGNVNGGYKDITYHYVNAGTTFRFSNTFALQPSFMARVANEVPVSWDVNMNTLIGNAFEAGISYRHKDSFGARFGVQASPKIYLGYIYEMPISALSKVTGQTHEIAVRLTIFKKEAKTEKE
ncbi:type IX secretion system membrane protein PorP/SprF [Pseudarcicella sp. GAP-15]|jgi:type IX secretion system PorP/SprF family membrane protein|nr:type IX secretion system membrane protein PorP/SprF [Pseudarcicella sp. GAP-15]